MTDGTTTNPDRPSAEAVHAQIVDGLEAVRHSRLLTQEEVFLWRTALGALELFYRADEMTEERADEILTRDGDLDQLVWDIVGQLSQYIGLQTAMPQSLKDGLRPEHVKGLNVRWQTIKAMVERFREEVDG
jgi:hypothetical protein